MKYWYKTMECRLLHIC